MTERNSTVRGRELGVRLRYHRTAAGLSERGAGAKLGVSVSTICRIERGYRNPDLEEVASLLAYYDVRGQERAELLDMAREVDQRGWWHQINPELGEKINILRSLESRASEITSFEVSRIPGLLQTELYTSALIRNCGRVPEDEIAASVAARMARRNILFRSAPVNFLALIDEVALRRTVGSAAVMHRQLDYLLHLARQLNIIIRVVPASASPRVASWDPFHRMDFPEAPTVIYTENATSELYAEDESETRTYKDIQNRLTALALSAGESAELISQLMRALEDDPDVRPDLGWPPMEEEQSQ